jgi:hypothetical protein
MNDLLKLRLVLGCFIMALILSGVTAFPLQHELDFLASSINPDGAHSDLVFWILTVRDGLRETYTRYPWLAYGTDWLAFAHIAIAIFFIGPWIDPGRNVWILKAGLIACVLVIPLALTCGSIRQIPFGWRLIDCSFGVFGAVPLYYCLRVARRLEKTVNPNK